MKTFNLNIPISKVDEEQRIVYGYATKEELDRQGDIVDYEASKKAFGSWAGNIREQHDAKRVIGKKVSMEFDDSNKQILVGAYISKSPDGENAWTKVKEKLFTGFSIGGKIKSIIKEKSGDTEANRIMDYDLSELSLVDVPACPSAQLVMVKSVDGKVKEVEEMYETDDGQPLPWFMKSYAYAPEQVNQNRESGNNKIMSKQSKEPSMSEDKQVNKAGVATYGGVARDDTAQPVNAEVAGGQPDESRPPEHKIDEKVIGIPQEKAPKDNGETVTPKPDELDTDKLSAKENDKSDSKAVTVDTKASNKKSKSDDPSMKKGLYTVSQLADCVSNLTWIVSDAEWEAQFDGGSSAAAEQLKAAVKSVGDALVALTTEAVDDLNSDVELSTKPTDLMKAVDMKFESTKNDMLKAVGDTVAAKVTEIVKPLEERIKSIESQPAGQAPSRSYVEVEKTVETDQPDEMTQLMQKSDDMVANPGKYSVNERNELVQRLMIAKSRQRGVVTA